MHKFNFYEEKIKQNKKLPLLGFEPTTSGLQSRRVTHYTTGFNDVLRLQKHNEVRAKKRYCFERPHLQVE